MELVDSAREMYRSETFEKYWALYKSGLDIQDVDTFLVKSVESIGYIGVSVLGEGLLETWPESGFSRVVSYT